MGMETPFNFVKTEAMIKMDVLAVQLSLPCKMR